MEKCQRTYERWQGERETYLERARDSSKLTIPTLIPEAGNSASTKYETPFQSVGSRGVNNLANALNISLLPPNAPFFRLMLDTKAKQEIEGASDIKGEIEDSLSKMEREIMREVESNNFRIGSFEALKHLIVSGNVLLHVTEDGGIEGSAASAKLLFMVAPNGVTRKARIAQAPNGAIIEGNAGDVTTLQTQKHADFRVAFETINQISERLNYAFMLTEAAIRRAERVTAEEVRLVTQAIERQLGGIYSVLSQEFQLPLVKILMSQMTKSKKLPPLPKGFVQPVVITGVEALGRGQDLNKLDSFIAGIGQVLGPEGLMQYVNISEYLKRRAASVGLDTDGLIRSEEELAQQAQQAQMSQMVSELGPNAVNAMGNVSQEQIKQQAQMEGA
jgi:hypothetical protein